MHFLREDIKQPENTENRACSNTCWWGTGTLTWWQMSPEKKNGLKRGSTGFLRSLFGQVSMYLELFTFSIGRNQFRTCRTFLGETSENILISIVYLQKGIYIPLSAPYSRGCYKPRPPHMAPNKKQASQAPPSLLNKQYLFVLSLTKNWISKTNSRLHLILWSVVQQKQQKMKVNAKQILIQCNPFNLSLTICPQNKHLSMFHPHVVIIKD